MFVKNLLYKLKQDWLKLLAATLTIVWILVLLFPLYWLFVSSTKDSSEAMKNPPSLGIVLPKNYTIYLDTTGLEDYNEEDFQYEALVLQWLLPLENQDKGLNLNSITVARVENNVVISTAKLNYATFTNSEKKNAVFKGTISEDRIKKYRDEGHERYTILLSYMQEDGYQTGLNKTPNLKQSSENITKMLNHLQNAMDPLNNDLSSAKKITTVRGTVIGISHKGSFLGLFRNYVEAYINGSDRVLEEGYEDERTYPFIKYMGNSVFVAVMAVLLQFVFSACVAYGLSFLVRKDIARKILLFFVVTIMLPGIVEQIPLYTTLVRLNLDNYWGVLLPGATSATFIVLFKGFFDQLPRELREAAKLDGAGEFYIYFNLAVPLSMPVFGAVGIMTFLGQWNAFFWPNLLLGNQETLKTFPLVINAAMNTNDSVKNYSLSLAMSVIATIPTFFMFAFMQKQMRAGLVLGSLKG